MFHSSMPRGARLGVEILVALVLSACGWHAVWASCNQIPGTVNSFRSSLGSTDRPFARPGDFVELRLDPNCHAGLSAGFGATAGEHVVTVIFTPPAGPRNVVILAENCTAIEAQRAACEARGDVERAICQTANGSGAPIDLEVVGDGGDRRLRFRFPDTDELLGLADDDRTLAGPAALAVTRSGDPLPCGLASGACAGESGLIACVDEFFAIDGTCGRVLDEPFGHFTALPPPNDYQALCSEPVPPCTSQANELRFTIDQAGNVLVPMDWRGMLLGEGIPLGRLVKGTAVLEALLGSGEPLGIPTREYLGSYSPKGGKLPPIFEPKVDPHDLGVGLTLFGTADSPETVLVVLRRSPTGRACQGGDYNGMPCSDSAQCGGKQCGAAPLLFDFSDRFLEGVGPVVVPRFGPGICRVSGEQCATDAECPASRCVSYQLVAEDPVPREGAIETNKLLAFAVPEALDAEDLNGDQDTDDQVLLIRDRATGEIVPTGEQGTEGRALTRINDPPFTYPATAAEGNVVAFLEPEPMQGGQDTNNNDNVFDTIIRVYATVNGAAVEITDPAQPLAADGAPLINGRSVLISNGLVFFRSPEAANARNVTRRVSVASDGEEGNGPSEDPSVSGDGHLVAFVSAADNLVEGDTNGANDVFVHDVGTGKTTRVSVSSAGEQGNYDSRAPAISADGRFVAFESDADNLVDNDTNGFTDIFVRDLLTSTTSRVSVNSSGEQGNASSYAPAISAEGRFIAFQSLADNLGSALSVWDVYIHDRLTGETTRVGEGQDSFSPSMSADGRFVAFQHTAFAAWDVSIFVRDRMTGLVSRANVSTAGEIGNWYSDSPAFSAGGRFVAFESFATNLVAGDTNNAWDVFVHDLLTGHTLRASVNSAGKQGIHQGAIRPFSFAPAISGDGRFIAFESDASNLARSDTNDLRDIFVRDPLAQRTMRVSLTAGGGQGNGPSRSAAISIDGRFTAFESDASNLVDNDTNSAADIFLRGPQSGDPAADITGDGDTDDIVLMVVSGRSPGIGAVKNLCPAGEVSVAAGMAALLRPESAGMTANANCTGANLSGPDLNGDGDAEDQVVLLWTGSKMLNLRCAAASVSLSGSYVAALVSEEGEGHRSLNGDGDTDDTVVHVRKVGDGAPSSCSDWINIGQAAQVVGVSGSVVTMVTAEDAQGADLNGDGDTADRVLQIYDAATGAPIRYAAVAKAAEEFVMSDTLVAFRTPEGSQGEDLNGDGDVNDFVMHVYDVVSGVLFNTHQAAIRCEYESCEPRMPYSVGRDTVEFLTAESDQEEDLNGDGDQLDKVRQIFNVPMANRTLAHASLLGPGRTWQRYSRTRIQGGTVVPGEITTLGAVKTGVCASSGEACVADGDCPSSQCIVPPGACMKDLGKPCILKDQGAACGSGEFCVSRDVASVDGTCHSKGPSCTSSEECEPLAVCRGVGQDVQRLLGPLSRRNGGARAFVSSGVCVEKTETACGANGECAASQTCSRDGRCVQYHGTCRTDADCPGSASCQPDLILVGAADSDGDEIPDTFDNCPKVANVSQDDEDRDGVGDACEAALVCQPWEGCCASNCWGRDEAMCQAALGKRLRVYTAKRLGAMQRCLNRVNRGKAPGPCPDPRNFASLRKTADRVDAGLRKKCAKLGLDLNRLGFGVECNLLAMTETGNTCAKLPVGDFGELGVCVRCWLDDRVERLLRLVYPNLQEKIAGTAEPECGIPPAQGPIRKDACLETMAAQATKLFLGEETALEKCLDKYYRGKPLFKDKDKAVQLADPQECAFEYSVARSLAKLRAKMAAKMRKRCVEMPPFWDFCPWRCDLQIESVDALIECVGSLVDRLARETVCVQYPGAACP